MKIKSLMLLTFLTFNGQTANAIESLKTIHGQEKKNQTNTIKKNKEIWKQITPAFLYSNIDFDFNSTINSNFNRFQGHSDLYTLGADHIVVTPDLIAGLYVFRIDTDVSSQILLAPSAVTNSYQIIHNNTLFGHARKSFTPHIDMDLGLGFGQNRIATQTVIQVNTPFQALGLAKNSNINWFTSLNLIYKKNWQKALLKAYAGVLYSQIDSDNYTLYFNSGLPQQLVRPLTNKVTYVMEGVELSYKLNSAITPFINAGLIQVAQFSLSRPTDPTIINGSLPQLNMDQNGYKLGGGISFTHKQFTLRLEEKYYSAGGTYSSNQTIAGLEYRFS